MDAFEATLREDLRETGDVLEQVAKVLKSGVSLPEMQEALGRVRFAVWEVDTELQTAVDWENRELLRQEEAECTRKRLVAMADEQEESQYETDPDDRQYDDCDVEPRDYDGNEVL